MQHLNKQIAGLVRDNKRLITKTHANKDGIERIDDLVKKLAEAEVENEHMRQQIMGMKRVTNEQSKALHKLENYNEFPTRIKILVDELKYIKDRLKETQEDLKKEKKLTADLHFQNRKLVEAMSEMKLKNNQSHKVISLDENEGVDTMTSNEKVTLTGWNSNKQE